jgi:cyclophilin family peptidyl-prolyl cis-trans isomerase
MATGSKVRATRSGIGDWRAAAAAGLTVLVLGGCGAAQPADEAPAAPSANGNVGGEGASAEAPMIASSPSAMSQATPDAASAACWPDGAMGAAGTTTEGAPVAKQYPAPPAMAIDPAKTYTATLLTSKGAIEVAFFPEEAPQTVNNFVCLARDGYYDGTPFHRIVSGFVIQGGDPTGTGSGGPGYRFADEPVSRAYTKGILAMANAGPNTNGSQFFIVTGADVGLPPNYTIFGEVTGGMDVVDALAATPTRRAPGSREQSSPTEPVTLESVTVSET